MSLPMLLPGSCCPMLAPPGTSAAASSCPGDLQPPLAPPRARWTASHRGGAAGWPLPPPRGPPGFCTLPPPLSLLPAAAVAAGPSSQHRGSAGLLPARPLLSLGLLQLILGCCMVALSFGALSLSGSLQIKNSCPFWAGSSVILSGIIGLTTWRRPMVLLVNLFVLLSVVCVLLNLAGFILGCQGAQFVSSMTSCQLTDFSVGRICICCEDTQTAKCTEKENALRLYPVQSCSAVHLLLKEEGQISAEEAEEHGRFPDPEDFVPPAPPPSYFSTFYSCTPRMNHRIHSTDLIPLPHIYGSRMKGVEVFCPMEPPPPYEAVVGQRSEPQGTAIQITEVASVDVGTMEPNNIQMPQDGETPSTSAPPTSVPSASGLPSSDSGNISSPNPTPASVPEHKSSCRRRILKRSNSDPVLHGAPARGPVASCEAATQTELRPKFAAVTLRRALRTRAARARPRSLVDYKSYIDTKLLVAKFLEESPCSMTPDIQELVDNIKSVLKSDEEHMDEAITSANFLDQVMTPTQPSGSRGPHSLPFRRHPGLLHLESCGDLSTFTSTEGPRVERRGHRADHERPHSLIGVIRETVL
ncbi:endosomal transmembrane epsin interactor 1 isoform X2 [Ambystoma mexicanum]|uniref:endosomal transmembrane epsin interactor 1 isoform X2 n=1 Tax=Ambystoma mexicanum TaxID=8296 RepID=UPI0037E773CA